MNRVYELTQRTNQMNFSGNIYHKGNIEQLSSDSSLDKYVMHCEDRFGDYGIIGFGIVDKERNRLIDLMFSCRIQSKRIEHAFISYCLESYLPKGDFYVKYRHTDRNKFSAQVFDDFDFEDYSKKSEYSFIEIPKRQDHT